MCSPVIIRRRHGDIVRGPGPGPMATMREREGKGGRDGAGGGLSLFFSLAFLSFSGGVT